jgi:hypothetical protein
MENTPYSGIIGNSQAPYINSLAAQGAVAGNYTATDHPSLPNYAELTSGQSFPNASSDCDPSPSCQSNARNLADTITASGRTWKSYEESMGTACNKSSSGQYAGKHNPFIYYTGIREDAARCAHIVPLTAMAADFASPSTAPAYSFVTPDMCHDAHDCDMAEADRWLSAFARSLMDSPGFSSGRSLLVVTFDEGESDSQRVFTVFAGPSVKPGYRSAAAYNHYSLLRTIEDNFGLAPLSDSDASARPMSEFFRTP